MIAKKIQRFSRSSWADAYRTGRDVWERRVDYTPAFAIDYVKCVMKLKEGSMLDLGCGAGNTTVAFARSRAFDRITAIDFVKPAIYELRKRAGKLGKLKGVINAEVGDIKRYRINGQYDVITCLRVLQNFGIGTQRSLMKDFQKHTAPGGINVVTLPYNKGRKGLAGYVRFYEAAGWRIIYEQARKPVSKFVKLKGNNVAMKGDVYILSLVARRPG